MHDMQLLCDKRFAGYLRNRKDTKAFLKDIENELSKMYEKMSDGNELFKKQYTGDRFDPKKIFGDIYKCLKSTTKVAVNYNALIEILEKVRSYLSIFSGMIINNYDDSKNQENGKKR